MAVADFLRRRRARLLIGRAQPFADETLFAVAQFTSIGNGMGAGGLPNWTMIGAGATRLYIIESQHLRPDKGVSLVASWPLSAVQITEENSDRTGAPRPLGAWGAVCFELPDRQPAVLQALGVEVDDLLVAHRAAQAPDLTGVRWNALTEVSLRTTSGGPADEDVFFVFAYDDGASTAIGLGDSDYLLERLQQLPGFDNETFIKAMGVSEDGVAVLWRR